MQSGYSRTSERLDHTHRQCRVRQYRSRVSKWGLDKKIKQKEMQAIVRKRQERKILQGDKPELVFHVRGREVETKKVDRWMRDHGIDEYALYLPSSGACEHLLQLDCRSMLTKRSNTTNCHLGRNH